MSHELAAQTEREASGLQHGVAGLQQAGPEHREVRASADLARRELHEPLTDPEAPPDLHELVPGAVLRRRRGGGHGSGSREPGVHVVRGQPVPISPTILGGLAQTERVALAEPSDEAGEIVPHAVAEAAVAPARARCRRARRLRAARSRAPAPVPSGTMRSTTPCSRRPRSRRRRGRTRRAAGWERWPRAPGRRAPPPSTTRPVLGAGGESHLASSHAGTTPRDLGSPTDRGCSPGASAASRRNP